MTKSEEKVTVKVASKALSVSERTIQRYLEKGILSKIKEGRRVYIPTSEITTLRQRQSKSVSRQVNDTTTYKVSYTTGQTTLSTEKYEAMVAELAELKERNKLLLEYKLTGDQVKKELEETRQKLQKAETEIARLKKPLFKRIVEQVIKK